MPDHVQRIIGGDRGHLTVAVILMDRTNPKNAQMEIRTMTWQRGGGQLDRPVQFVVQRAMADPEIVIGSTSPVRKRGGGGLNMKTEIYMRVRLGDTANVGQTVDVQPDVRFNLREV